MAVVLGLAATLVVGPWAGPAPAQSLQEYRLGPGDRLSIKVFGNDDLSGEFEVDSLGRMSLPLLGLVEANNKTIAELQAEVTDGLDRDYIVNPRVTIQVINYRPFFILGQVTKPGSYPYIAGITVRQAIAVAGGFTRRAREEPVIVIHANDPGFAKNEVGLDTPVLPGDTLEVERRLF
ncbi:MAG: polysaccharide biosynthesis/export family protein [Alphaproteobacteria bacterium]